MFLPAEYVWLEPVIIASVVVFFIDWIGNSITFSNRIINAFMTALIFGLIFAALTYFGFGSIEMSLSTSPAPGAPGATSVN
ncbi:MAG: hypothetical protein HC850_11085 [Rhodomicrobium sp.]|nr:hypothetical protein [Rhodomicrobium sp.]